MNPQLKKLINIYIKNKKYFSDVLWAYLYCDEPQMYAFNIYVKNLKKYSDGFYSQNEPHSTGASFKLEKALMKCIGEIIERYCCSIYQKKDLLFGSSSELVSTVNPNDFSKYTNELKNNNNKFKINEKDKFYWVKGKSLNKDREILLPAQLIYTNYIYGEKEKIIQYSSSNGAAAGFSIENAIYKGIMELVEREAFLIYYLNKISPKQVRNSSITNKEIKLILKKIKEYNLELKILDISTDLDIPIYLAIITDPTEVGMPISLGAKADISSDSSIIGSIEEALQVRTWMRNNYESNKSQFLVKNKNEITSIIQRGIYWYDPDLIKTMDFFLKTKNIIDYIPQENILNENSINEIKKKLTKNKIDIYYTDLTTPNFKKLGYYVIKTVSPQIMPIYFQEKHPFFNCERLYQVPVKLGYFKEPKTEGRLNEIPHNFL